MGENSVGAPLPGGERSRSINCTKNADTKTENVHINTVLGPGVRTQWFQKLHCRLEKELTCIRASSSLDIYANIIGGKLEPLKCTRHSVIKPVWGSCSWKDCQLGVQGQQKNG